MQEFRNYFHGLNSAVGLYILRNGKRKWASCGVFVSVDPYRGIEKGQYGAGQFELIGTHTSLRTGLEVTDLHIPTLCIAKLDNPTYALWSHALGEVESQYSVWGVHWATGRWELLSCHRPTLTEIEKLRVNAPYDSIKLCKHTPKLALWETCEFEIMHESTNKTEHEGGLPSNTQEQNIGTACGVAIPETGLDELY